MPISRCPRLRAAIPTSTVQLRAAAQPVLSPRTALGSARRSEPLGRRARHALLRLRRPHLAHRPAHSDDGIHWAKVGAVLAPDPHTWEGSYIAANGSALRGAGEFWYWYVGRAPRDARASGWRARPTDRLAEGTPIRCCSPDPTGAGTNTAWPIPYVVAGESGSFISTTWARIARAGSGWAWPGPPTASTGRSCGPTQFWNWAAPAPSTRTAWASRRSGSPDGSYWMLYTGRDRRTKTGAWAWPARPTACTGKSSRRVPRAPSPGTPRWSATPPLKPQGDAVRVWFGGGDVARRPMRISTARSASRFCACRCYSGEVNVGITCYPTYGGSGIVATELGMELAARGHEVHFISYANPIRLDPDTPRIHYHEVEVSTYPLFQYPPYCLALASRMAEVAESYELDLLHVHYAIPHSIAAMLAQQMLAAVRRLPFITTLHGTDITLVGTDRSYFPITKFSIEQSDGITSISEYLREQTVEVFGSRTKSG